MFIEYSTVIKCIHNKMFACSVVIQRNRVDSRDLLKTPRSSKRNVLGQSRFFGIRMMKDYKFEEVLRMSRSDPGPILITFCETSCLTLRQTVMISMKINPSIEIVSACTEY